MLTTATTGTSRPKRTRRGSLLVKTLAIAVLPVVIVGVIVTAILLAQRAATLRLVGQSVATSVARVLATSLDVQNLSLVLIQLEAAVSSDSVAFVDVRPAESETRFFMSQRPEIDWYLREAYDRASVGGGKTFRFRDDLADRYREALAAVQGDDPRTLVREHLEGAIRRFEASRGQVQNFQIERLSVYETPTGVRIVRSGGEAAPTAAVKLFDLGIAVRGDDVTALMNLQLGLVVGACVLVAALAALAASVAARRLVRPILSITAATNNISLGRIDERVEVDSDDELHDLAQSVERLRVSLELALRRLRPQG